MAKGKLTAVLVLVACGGPPAGPISQPPKVRAPDVECRWAAADDAACNRGDMAACYALAQRSEGKKRTILVERLAKECERDTICGCAMYGGALAGDESRAVEGLAILDQACERGAIVACDDVDLLMSLCTQDPTPSVCIELEKQGRKLPPEPPPPKRIVLDKLPPELTGCFVVDSPDGVGTAECFEPKRIFSRALGKRWNVRGAQLERIEGRDEIILDGTVHLKVGRNGLTIGSVHLSRGDAAARAQMEREIAALPDVYVVCTHARACVHAIDSLVPRIADEGPLEANFADDLWQCEAGERDAKKLVKTLPSECQ